MTDFLAGQVVDEEMMNRIRPRVLSQAASGSLTSTSTTEQDIPGASIVVTTETDGATWEVDADFDCNVLATSATVLMLGKLQVDGVTQTEEAIFAMDTLLRATVSKGWDGVLASAGSHTFKLRGNLSGALATGGSFTFQNTRFRLTITEAM